jgi:hypothetical protein
MRVVFEFDFETAGDPPTQSQWPTKKTVCAALPLATFVAHVIMTHEDTLFDVRSTRDERSQAAGAYSVAGGRSDAHRVKRIVLDT